MYRMSTKNSPPLFLNAECVVKNEDNHDRFRSNNMWCVWTIFNLFSHKFGRIFRSHWSQMGNNNCCPENHYHKMNYYWQNSKVVFNSMCVCWDWERSDNGSEQRFRNISTYIWKGGSKQAAVLFIDQPYALHILEAKTHT